MMTQVPEKEATLFTDKSTSSLEKASAFLTALERSSAEQARRAKDAPMLILGVPISPSFVRSWIGDLPQDGVSSPYVNPPPQPWIGDLPQDGVSSPYVNPPPQPWTEPANPPLWGGPVRNVPMVPMVPSLPSKKPKWIPTTPDSREDIGPATVRNPVKSPSTKVAWSGRDLIERQRNIDTYSEEVAQLLLVIADVVSKQTNKEVAIEDVNFVVNFGGPSAKDSRMISVRIMLPIQCTMSIIQRLTEEGIVYDVSLYGEGGINTEGKRRYKKSNTKSKPKVKIAKDEEEAEVVPAGASDPGVSDREITF